MRPALKYDREDVSLAEGNQNDHEDVEDANQRRCKSALAGAEPNPAEKRGCCHIVCFL